ncbi:hypothetical protein [Amycolatopsis thermoflava]|uniref:hypothetical protein n=1 Tax=Amycolatopsis thermoflava TaxID=84480 RepID=UPI003EBFA05F
METGEQIRIFVDGEDIGWGQDWQETLDIGVGRTAFFIPTRTRSSALVATASSGWRASTASCAGS